MTDLHQLIHADDIDGLTAAIAAGCDLNQPGRLGVTPLMTAIQADNCPAFDLLLAHGADPECSDDFNHTALRVAVDHDRLWAVTTLITHGVDRGRSPKHPLKAIDYNIDKLLASVPRPDGISAEDWAEISGDSFDTLADMGRNPTPEPVIGYAISLPVLQALLDAGEPLDDADPELRRAYIGLPASDDITCSASDYQSDRRPRFGQSNPEPTTSPFLTAMIRSGVSAYDARQRFADHDLSQAVWCYDRFGHSLTPLPDGRFVGIGGEHEDHYDPDFCIYNDVVVHDGSGGMQIYRYPEHCFPPTDFHSATLVGERIVIIGSLGYRGQRRNAETPVYQLELASMAISPLPCGGDAPGWISRHRAQLSDDGQSIIIAGGQVWQEDADGQESLRENDLRYRLHLPTATWQRC